MICKQCGTENNEAAKFCRACGAKLEMPAPPERNYCSKCGMENNPESAFCRNCGNSLKGAGVRQQFRPGPSSGPTTGPSPGPSMQASSGFGAAKESLGPKLAELFKMTFKCPVEYMQKAVKNDDYWLATVFVALIADLIFALIPAIALGSAISGYGVSGYGSSVIKVFFGIFIAMVVIEALCILALFAAEKIFGCSCTLKNVVAVLGPVYFLSGLALIVILLFTVTGSGGMILIANIIAVPLMIMSSVIMMKAHEVVSGLKDARMVYAFVVYVVIAIVVIAIILAIAGAGLRNTGALNFGYFLNNLLNY